MRVNTLPDINVGHMDMKMAATGTDGRAAPDTARRPPNPAIHRANTQPTGSKDDDNDGTGDGQYLPANAMDCAKMHCEALPEKEKPAVGFEPTTTRLQGGRGTFVIY